MYTWYTTTQPYVQWCPVHLSIYLPFLRHGNGRLNEIWHIRLLIIEFYS